MPVATEDWVLDVLGRDEHLFDQKLSFGRVLVTGAAGSIGQVILEDLILNAGETCLTDIEGNRRLDVTRDWEVNSIVSDMRPHTIIHLAGAKHAPEGEIDPYAAMMVNTVGTRNVLEAAARVGAHVVVASTCKACDPETAYGASKLIAERMALNAGATVIRFYNVIETCGNVFQIWKSIPSELPIPVAATCERLFMTANEAQALTLWAAAYRLPGRFVLGGVIRRSMNSVALDLYPDRQIEWIPPRRGDRLVEPFAARSEEIAPTDYPPFMRVVGPHDPL